MDVWLNGRLFNLLRWRLSHTSPLTFTFSCIFGVQILWPSSFCPLLFSCSPKREEKNVFLLNNVRIACSSLIFQRFPSQFSPSLWFFICISASSFVCVYFSFFDAHEHATVCCMFSGRDSGRAEDQERHTRLQIMSNNNLLTKISFGHCVSQQPAAAEVNQLFNFHLLRHQSNGRVPLLCPKRNYIICKSLALFILRLKLTLNLVDKSSKFMRQIHWEPVRMLFK